MCTGSIGLRLMCAGQDPVPSADSWLPPCGSPAFEKWSVCFPISTPAGGGNRLPAGRVALRGGHGLPSPLARWILSFWLPPPGCGRETERAGLCTAQRSTCNLQARLPPLPCDLFSLSDASKEFTQVNSSTSIKVGK